MVGTILIFPFIATILIIIVVCVGGKIGPFIYVALFGFTFQ